MTKRVIILSLSVLLCVLLVSGCGKKARQKAEEAEQKAAAAEAKAMELEQQLKTARSGAENAESALKTTQQQLNAAQDQMKKYKTELEEAQSKINNLQSQMTRMEQNQSSKIDELKTRLGSLESELADSRAKLTTAQRSKANLEKQLSSIKQKYEQAQARIDSLVSERQELMNELSQLQKKKVGKNGVRNYQDNGNGKNGNGVAQNGKNGRGKRGKDKSDYWSKAKKGERQDWEYPEWGEENQDRPAELEITLESTWVSKYIWRGFDLQDDKAAWQPSANFDLWQTGFSFNLWFNVPGSSGTSTTSTVNAEEIDFTLTYANKFFRDEYFQTNYAVSYVYYDYPDMGTEDADIQEMNLYLEWPNVCSVVTPHYGLFYLWPASGGGLAHDLDGWIHDFGFTYDFDTPAILPGTDHQSFTFGWDIIYNDGAGLGDGSVEHDWSHILWSLSTDVSLGEYGSLTPAIYYQTSMEDSVNRNDEYWVGITYSYTF